MSLFKQFSTDKEAEQNGVRVEYGANEDGTIPTFILARAGKSNKRYAQALDRESRPHRRAMQMGTMDEAKSQQIMVKVFAETVLIGWEHIQGRDGSTLAYSPQNARDLLDALPELFDDLQEKAQSAALFRDTSLDEEGKN